jgi:hypothetical protein
MGSERGGRGRVGGASAAAGVGYQEGVTAWLASHLLAEEQAPPLPSLAATERVTSTASETSQPIDDINVSTTAGRTLYVQAKRAVPQLVDRKGSDFTDFVEQSVDQHLALRSTGQEPRSQYVLATSPDASSKVRRELRQVLDRLRDAPRDTKLDSFASTKGQRDAMRTTASIIERRLRERVPEPTAELIREVLERIVVWELDVDGPARSTAITILGATVVPTSTIGAQAWRVLEQRALKAAQDHDTLDLHGWRRALHMEGIGLRGIPSLEADVSRVRAHSTRALADLERHCVLRVAGTDVTIDREAIDVAHRLVHGGPLLLVGDAGSGKSAILAALARRLQADGADVVVLDADAITATSLGALSRELLLEHDVGDVLDGWPGQGRGYLIVDGLDETRGSPGVPALHRLVGRVASADTWVPVVAVRRFDLRYSSELRQVFDGTHGEAAWLDPEFTGIRHVVVGDLSDPELDQLRGSAPALVRMARDPGVGPLLRRPIHLQLAAELLTRGGGEADIARLRSQLGLLDLYWSRTIEEPLARRASREAVVTTACTIAVAERRFSFQRRELEAADADATTDLLGLGFLVEGEAQPGSARRVRFLHGLVADYAIARLVLSPPGAAGGLLVGDPVNALFLRRSLELWLAGLWESDPSRTTFWDVSLGLCEQGGVPEIARLVAPTIAADSWTDIVELEPLLAALISGRRNAALVALRHLIASLTTPPHVPVAGAEASPWSTLALRLVGQLATDVVFPARLLVMLLSDARAALTGPQMADLGEAARRLLVWLWDNDNQDTYAARFAIAAVCISFASDPAASVALLRRGLCRGHVQRRGYDELSHYAEHVEDLEASPGLVVALYTAAFAFDHVSGSEPDVPIGGPVLSIVSNRAQEFRIARYELARVFDGLMARRPEIATAALLRVLRASSNLRRHRYESGAYARFVTEGIECRVRDEWSAQTVAWLSTHDDEATLIKGWSSGLATLAQSADARLATSLATFLSENHTYAGWRVLIDAGTSDPRLAAKVARVIATASPILSSSSLHEPLCRLMMVIRQQSELVTDLRAALEVAALDADARARLSECLEGTGPPAHATEDVDADDVPDSQASETADTPTPERILEGWARDQNEDAAPVPATVRSAFATFTSSLDRHAEEDEEHWRLATRAGERIARVDQNCDGDETRIVAEVLLRALDVPDGPDDGWDGDERVSIPSHSCVLDAVDGLARLHAAGLCDETIPAAIVLGIASHPLPWARSQLARVSGRFLAREPGLTWSILDRLAADQAPHVAADAAGMATRFRRQDPDRANAILKRVLEAHGTRSKVVGEAAMSLAGAFVLDGIEGVDRIGAMLEDAERVLDAAPLLHGLRPSLTPPAVGGDEPERTHRAAIAILRTVAASGVRRYDESDRRWNETKDDAARDRAVDAARVLEAVVNEVYFASGAFHGNDDQPQPTQEQMTAFFDEVEDDLRGLLGHLPARAIHHVVEFAAANSDARPSEAFLLIGDAVRAARAVGYETDTLAKDLVLRLVRSYMADRSGLFQGSTSPARRMQAALVDILDSFVAVGWPEARAMAYHLYEVLR